MADILKLVNYESYSNLATFALTLVWGTHCIQKKTFKGRLPDLMDQAQHFTGTASAAARSGGDEVGAEFRSGLDATERECEYGWGVVYH